DLIATATRFTAASIAENIARFVVPRCGRIDEMLIAGGGSRNDFLVSCIDEELRRCVGEQETPRVRRLDETGFDAKARECIAFAILGYANLKGIPANIPAATGAKHPA